MSERTLGIWTLISGLVAGYFSMVEPILAASRHEAEVKPRFIFACLAVIMVEGGLVLAVLGERFKKIGPAVNARMSFVFMVVAIGASVMGMRMIQGYGYEMPMLDTLWRLVTGR